MSRQGRRFSLTDVSLHIISLALAVLLWYFVVGEDQVDMNVEVPIEIINLPPNLIISNQYKEEIEVSVRGPRSLLQNLRDTPIYRSVDLARAEPGPFVVKNDEDSIPFPRGITVVRLQPSSIVLLLDELVEKNLPIEAVTVGQPAAGYALKSLVLKPDSLAVTGPKNVLSGVTSLKTSLIYLSGLDKSVKRQVRLDLPADMQKFVGEIMVAVEIVVEDEMRRQVVEHVPVLLGPDMRGYQVRPPEVSITADIPINLLNRLRDPARLFKVSLPDQVLEQSRSMEVQVYAAPQPGHAAVRVVEVRPRQVLVIPPDQEGAGTGGASATVPSARERSAPSRDETEPVQQPTQ